MSADSGLSFCVPRLSHLSRYLSHLGCPVSHCGIGFTPRHTLLLTRRRVGGTCRPLGRIGCEPIGTALGSCVWLRHGEVVFLRIVDGRGRRSGKGNAATMIGEQPGEGIVPRVRSCRIVAVGDSPSFGTVFRYGLSDETLPTQAIRGGREV